MRIRAVKPEFWNDVKLQGLPLETRLTFIGLWNEADDAGILRWDPEQIGMDLYRDRSDRVELVKAAVTALKRRGRIEDLGCRRHLRIPHLQKHQRFHSDPSRRAYTHKREHDTECLPEGSRGVASRLPAREGRGGKVKVKRLETNSNAHARGGSPERLGDALKRHGWTASEEEKH